MKYAKIQNAVQNILQQHEYRPSVFAVIDHTLTEVTEPQVRALMLYAAKLAKSSFKKFEDFNASVRLPLGEDCTMTVNCFTPEGKLVKAMPKGFMDVNDSLAMELFDLTDEE